MRGTNTVAAQTAPLIQAVLHEANKLAAACAQVPLPPSVELQRRALVAALKELER